MKEKDYLLSFVLTVVLIAAVFYIVDLGKVASVLAKANLVFILLAVVSYLVLNGLMAYRIKVLLAELGNKIPMLDAIKANFSGMLASDFTPARSGYFFTAFSLSSKFNVPVEKTVLSIFGPQMLEFVIKAIALTVMIIFLAQRTVMTTDNTIIVAVSILAIFGIIGFFTALLLSSALLSRFSFMKRIALGRKFFYLFHLMQQHSNAVLKHWKLVIGVSTVTWILKGIEWFFLAKALGITMFGNDILDASFFLLLHPTITLIHFIPIPTLAGAGTSEAAFTGLLYLFGIAPETAFSLAVLTRLLMIFVDLLGAPTIAEFAQKNGVFAILNQVDEIEKRVEGGE